MSAPCQSYVLGLDLGTNSVKAVLVESKSRILVNTQTRDTLASAPSQDGEQAREQDVSRIVSALHQCLAALPGNRLHKVVRVGISGQMHGVVLWAAKAGCSWQASADGLTFLPEQVSQLVTWQDGRCNSEFLASLARPDSHILPSTGFGCATLFWYLRNRPGFLKPYSAAGTIHDYVVAMLCGLEKPLMSPHNAASWGYYNTKSGSWNLQILGDAGFPTWLLPTVVEPGTVAGQTCSEWCGVPQGTDVGVAFGDFQAAVYSCMKEKTDAVLNISTSAQLTFAPAPGFEPPAQPNPGAAVAYVPYFDGTHLAVAAALNGGNVLSTFVRTVTQWMQELGVDAPAEPIIYSHLIDAARDLPHTDLTIQPTLLGERHLPGQLASVLNISPTNLSLAHLTRALCRGVVENIHSMLPCRQLVEAGVRRILGSGSALLRNEVLRQEVEKAFPLPIQYEQETDSAFGAALAMMGKQ
uniref:Sedoheptulokinase n=1 Tax=Callorhinchus milii TaxID=7868 RepID=A0A4W3JHL8_CALMI|eukprot:gi/632957876/ref/XP_007894724.1/ PREDICTED: sedoheptulokinase [Callorhinchus milii]